MSNTLYPLGDTDHNQQILAGFDKLRKTGEITFRYSYRYNESIRGSRIGYGPQRAYIVLFSLAGIGTIAFDTHDGGNVDKEIYDLSVLYFKRSFNAALHASYAKVRPLGLNYYVGREGFNLDGIERALRLSSNAREMIRGVLGASGLPILFNFDPSAGGIDRIVRDLQPRVLFIAGLWDPFDSPGRPQEQVDQRIRINQTRIGCISLLRKELGSRFTGGIVRSKFAEKNFPDFIVDQRISTRRRDFIKHVSEHSICISSVGLHQSTGWKFAEYIALGRAVVAEKMYFGANSLSSKRSEFS